MDSSLLVTHSRVNLDGSEGTVFSTDPNLTYLIRESGKVDIYTTESVVANGEPVLSDDEAQEARDNADKDAEIASLRQQLANAQAGDPGVTGTPPAPADVPPTSDVPPVSGVQTPGSPADPSRQQA